MLFRSGGSVPSFRDFPATPQKLSPVTPIVTAPYRLFRTAIRRGARFGPNFAGHFTVVEWGAGAGGVCWAIVDAKSGKLGDGGCAETGGVDGQQPQFRLDSRLLILTGGLRGERDGVAYYEWTGSKLRELRFIPATELCERKLSSP